MKQSIGIIGGKPKHAFWFFGCQGMWTFNKRDLSLNSNIVSLGNQLLYLDPHTTHMSVNPEMKSNIPDKVPFTSRSDHCCTSHVIFCLELPLQFNKLPPHFRSRPIHLTSKLRCNLLEQDPMATLKKLTHGHGE